MDVKTAGRTIDIFEAFAKEQEPLSLTDLSRILGVPLSSCLYLVRTLERLGYIYGVGARKNLYPTRKLLDVATAIAAGETWIDRIEPVLAKLRNDSMETVILGKRQGAKVVYLAVLEGPQTIRYGARVGDLKPLHSSAIGKAMLAATPETDRARLLAKLELVGVTPNTIVDRDVLLADVRKTLERGYALTSGENVPDVMAVAQTVKLKGDSFAIAVAGPLYRMKDVIDEQVARLKEACAEAAKR